MAETTVPFRLEDRFVSDGSLIAATEQGFNGPLVDPGETARRFTRELREHPTRYLPDAGYRLVIPASRRPLFEPDEAAWQASAARRKAGA